MSNYLVIRVFSWYIAGETRSGTCSNEYLFTQNGIASGRDFKRFLYRKVWDSEFFSGI